MSWDIQGFREKLESQHQFPGKYTFKFIVPSDSISKVEDLWVGGKVTLRPSSKGKYTSITIEAEASSSDEIIKTYELASNIDGCIAL